MTYYIRTSSSTDGSVYENKNDAVKQVQMNMARQRANGRVVSREGKQILFSEKTGKLFDVIWVEDEDGNRVHVPDV